MTTAHDIDWPTVLADRLTTTHPDVLRELLSTFIHTPCWVPKQTPCAAPDTASAAVRGPISAAATGIVNSTPGQEHWIWEYPSCATVRTSPTGCWNAANGPNVL